MRVIEKRWKYVEAGYKDLQAFGTQLDIQWKRPLQVAQRRKFKQEYATWKRNRRLFFLLALGFVLGCALLCGSAFFAEEWNIQCLSSFGAFLLLLFGTSFAIWGRRYIRSVYNPPVFEIPPAPAKRLVELWWNNVALSSHPAQDSEDEGVRVFLDLLKQNLPNSYLAVPEILTSIKKTTDTDVLLLGPSGIWAFEVKHWYGAVHKKNGIWWHTVSNRRIDLLQESGERKQGPDEQWLNQAREIKTTLKRRSPEVLSVVDHIQGGIVFSNPAVILHRSNIQGNQASYGEPGNWLNRIQTAQTVEGFNLLMQLRAIDAMIEYGLSIERDQLTPVSALKLAEWAHQKVSQELTEFVERWAK